MSCLNFVTVKVLAGTITKDAELYETTTYSVVETFEDVQFIPIGGEVAEKRYGITDRACTNELYIFEDTTMTENQKRNKLMINEKVYEVRRILSFNHKQVLIKPFTGDIEVI